MSPTINDSTVLPLDGCSSALILHGLKNFFSTSFIAWWLWRL
jgi:hypothetical protein